VLHARKLYIKAVHHCALFAQLLYIKAVHHCALFAQLLHVRAHAAAINQHRAAAQCRRVRQY